MNVCLSSTASPSSFVRGAFPPAVKSLKPPLISLFKVDMTSMASAATQIVSTPLPDYLRVVIIFAIVIGTAYWFHVCTIRIKVRLEHEVAKDKIAK